MISRKTAAEIALSDALAHHLGFSIREVISADEIRGRAPMLYDVGVRDCWIAYIENPGPPGLRARVPLSLSVAATEKSSIVVLHTTKVDPRYIAQGRRNASLINSAACHDKSRPKHALQKSGIPLFRDPILRAPAFIMPPARAAL